MSYTEYTLKKLSASLLFLLLTAILTRSPVVWSIHLYVRYTFIPSHLWHLESEYLVKLHHKSLSLAKSCENIRHLIDVVSLLPALSEKVLSALKVKSVGKCSMFLFLVSWLHCFPLVCVLALRKIIYEFSIIKTSQKSGQYWISLIYAKKFSTISLLLNCTHCLSTASGCIKIKNIKIPF